MVMKPSGKHTHINKPMGGKLAGEAAWERRRRPTAKHSRLAVTKEEAGDRALCPAANMAFTSHHLP